MTLSLCCRNGVDYTSAYGADKDEGILTPYLSSQLSADTHSVILDGEMMAWNMNLKSFTTKGNGS